MNMEFERQSSEGVEQCENDPAKALRDISLLIVSNRGPVSFSRDETGGKRIQRSGGGLVTAIRALAQSVAITWIASAVDELEREWGRGKIELEDGGCTIDLDLMPIEEDVYNGYYNVIANPLLWFLQHSMWDFVSGPMITRETWEAWEKGYVEANRQFANTVAGLINSDSQQSLVMIQDYHLYLMPRMLRNIIRRMRDGKRPVLVHFVHIPWPGSEDFRILPGTMRKAILNGLTGVDLLGFQTNQDSINFLQSVEAHLPGAFVNYRQRRIWYRNHATIVRDFPISIDVPAIRAVTASPETEIFKKEFAELVQDKQMILRVDRTDPSKNIVRGFQAFGEMLEQHPGHVGKVKFVAILVPSRLDVDEYHKYHDEIMAAAGWVNSKFGTDEWEPIRIFQGDNYTRAVAALQMYDVLLVNSIADGMNLVAKEGPAVNQNNGVLVLSERTGARQQLEPGALIISPCDLYATAEALHQALTMSAEERKTRSERLRRLVEGNDINTWFCDQINEISRLGFLTP